MATTGKKNHIKQNFQITTHNLCFEIPQKQEIAESEKNGAKGFYLVGVHRRKKIRNHVCRVCACFVVCFGAAQL